MDSYFSTKSGVNTEAIQSPARTNKEDHKKYNFLVPCWLKLILLPLILGVGLMCVFTKFIHHEIEKKKNTNTKTRHAPSGIDTSLTDTLFFF